MIITIDGPAASGKSTVALALAKQLNGYYIYSGLLFRAVAYILHTHAHYSAETIHDISAKDRERFLDAKKLVYLYSKQKGPQMLFDGVDVTQKLSDIKISNLASRVSTNKHVRVFLKDMQRTEAAKHTIVIADGRDSGSVVFPQADYSFYITATLEERVRRVQHAYIKKGVTISYQEVKHALQSRDARDSHRADAPLIKTSNAIEIDSTALSAQEVLKKIVYYIQGF